MTFDEIRPYTCIEDDRLENLARLCTNLPPGDVVECGVARGGSAAWLGAHMGDNRHLWMYDSLQGLPAPKPEDGDAAKAFTGANQTTRSCITEAMRLSKLQPSQWTLNEGWFVDTLDKMPGPSQVALLHIDADWFDSVLTCLRYFYDLIPDGGVIVLDDFGYWEGCRRAFYRFCEQSKVAPLLERCGTDQAYWIKGRESNRPW